MWIVSTLAISLLLFMVHFAGQSVQTSPTQGECLLLNEEEAAALEHLRTSLLRSDLNPPSSWVNKENDCCSWEGVECCRNVIANSTTTTTPFSFASAATSNRSSRMVVKGLFLSRITNNKPWYALNLGVFKAFRELQLLDLSSNYIGGPFKSLDITSLKKLQHLDLSNNNFEGGVPKTWAALTSLQYLDLRNNHLSNQLLTEDIFADMTKLEYLDLSNNFLGYNPFLERAHWAARSSLQFLYLGNAGLNGSFPAAITLLRELVKLELISNSFTGPLPDITDQKKIESLTLSYNKFEGGIPRSWVSLSSLKNLDLRNNNLSGPFPAQVLNCLSELTYLDVRENNLTQPLPVQDTVSRLSKLDALILSGNAFGGWPIPTFWASLPSLRLLDLSNTGLNCSFPADIIAGFKKLETLYLGSNSLEGWAIPISWASLPSLQILDLGNSKLNGSFLTDTVAGLTKLHYLQLRGNSFGGWTIPTSWASLSSLQDLDLSDTGLNCSFPIVLTLLPELGSLSLFGNSLSGPLPTQGLRKMKYLDLKSNQLEGEIPTSWATLSFLWYLDLSNNRLSGQLLGKAIIDLRNLKHLNLSYNRFHGGIPTSWATLSSLRVLDLSNNHLMDTFHGKGTFPSWFLQNQTSLEYLNLRNISLTGKFHNIFTQPIPNLKRVDMSLNNIIGSLSSNLESIFPSLQYFNLSTNFLIGNLHSSLFNISSLSVIDLSNNHFLGEIPLWQSSLAVLRLSNNNLQGDIPTNALPILTYLDENHLTGIIQNNLSIINKLTYLDVHDNQMSGTIPQSIYKSPNLIALIIRDNHFHGHIHPHICDLNNLSLLDISNNNLSGTLPKCSTPLPLHYLNMDHNAFQGSFSQGFFNTTSLMLLNARNNQFSNELPRWLGDLENIRILQLSQNHFEQGITTHICELQHLTMLDLSKNNLSTSIPPCLGNLGVKNWTKEQSLQDPFWNHFLGSSIQDDMVSKYINLEDVTFFTKGMVLPYEKQLLSLMAIIDLSSNKLTGSIPSEIGNLKMFKTLNLSHNQLVGAIPVSFSQLKQIESLDLSYNFLNGNIPMELVKLKSLSTFSVAYNNLSGCTPERRDQFGTFDAMSYEGNVYLRGPPLSISCVPNQTNSPSNRDKLEYLNNKSDIDRVIFYAISISSFIIFFWIAVFATYYSPVGRRLCIRMINRITTNFYYRLAFY